MNKYREYDVYGIQPPPIETTEWLEVKMEEMRMKKNMDKWMGNDIERLCPSFPYMCHNEKCGCRVDTTYHQVIQ